MKDRKAIKHFFLIGALVLGWLVGAGTASAELFAWSGAVDSQWRNADNWTNGTVPPAGADILFPENTSHRTVVMSGALGVNSLTFSGSGFLIQGAGRLEVQTGITNAYARDDATNLIGTPLECAGNQLAVVSQSSLHLTNTLDLGGHTILFNAASAASGILVSGQFTNAGVVQVGGPGLVQIQGGWSGSGARQIVVNSDRNNPLRLSGPALPDVDVQVAAFGFLQVDATLRSLNLGEGAGVFIGINGPGKLGIVQSLTLDPTSFLIFDQTDVNSAVGDQILLQPAATAQLNNAQLSFAFPSLPAVNTDIVLIAGGAISGRFGNLPADTFYVAGSSFYVPRYLAAQFSVRRSRHTSTGITSSWSGTGGNASWDQAANWAGATTPKPGNGLLFPSTTVPAASSNNIAGLTASQIAFATPNHTLRGLTLALFGDVIVTNQGNVGRLDLPLVVNDTPITFRAGNQCLLELTTNASLTAPGGLTAFGLGTNRLQGRVTTGNSSGLVKNGAGTLELGNARVGNLSLNAGTVFIRGPNNTPGQVIVEHTVSLTNAVTLQVVGAANSPPLAGQDVYLNDATLGGVTILGTLTNGQSLTLFQADHLVGTFSNVLNGAFITDAASGQLYRLNYAWSGVVLTAVPPGSDRPSFVSLTLQGGHEFRLHGTGVPGTLLNLEVSTNLVDWAPGGLPLLPVGPDGTFSFTFTVPNILAVPPSGFYRVRQQ